MNLLRSMDATVQIYVGDREGRFFPLEFQGRTLGLPAGSVYIAASLHSVNCNVRSVVDFIDLNPGVLIFLVPYIKGGDLDEVTISSVSNNDTGLVQIAVWGRFLRKLRSVLISGAQVTNRKSGFSEYYRSAHATVAAVTESKAGRVGLTSGNGKVLFDYVHKN